jgi:hypothetical protein
LNIDEDITSHGGSSGCLKESRGLKITFLRTTRMPDDDKLHALPAALGTFPLYSVSAYAKVLPDKMVQEGGVFMPMWQREALWIGLESESHFPYALRVCVGRINAVSGEEMNESLSTEDGSLAVQDYVVVPGQQWLDGICVGPGVVRQFVAMPRKYLLTQPYKLELTEMRCSWIWLHCRGAENRQREAWRSPN